MLRVLYIGFVVNAKQLLHSRLFKVAALFQPLVYATIAFYIFGTDARRGTMLYAALGAGMMGIWSTTLFGAGGTIQSHRWQRTLELGVAAPPPLVLIYLPATLATSAVGAYSLAATLVWARVVFDTPIELVHPFAFALSVAATIAALGVLGLGIAATFVLSRRATLLSNLLEYPVWIACGLMFPIALLPGWVQPIAWLLPPYWGVLAIRHAALGGDVWFPLGLTLVVGAGFSGLSVLALHYVENRVRAQATLSYS